jgi:hypothetical protein
MSEQKVARWGRPPKLDDALAIEIAALLLVGHSTTDVAQMLGVSRRSIVNWRARAWSRDERDRVCVKLERMISAGRAAAASEAYQRPAVNTTSSLQPLDELVRDLERAWT